LQFQLHWPFPLERERRLVPVTNSARVSMETTNAIETAICTSSMKLSPGVWII
jgi:hypothetical protein